MNCKLEKTENANEVKFEITVEAAKFEDAMKKVYFKSAKYFNIPGFRKGKAPMQIVEKYYGPEIFYEDAFNEVAQEALEEAIKENKLEVVSRPDIEVTQIEKGKDLIFTAVMQTKPEANLGKYKGIEIKKIEYNVSDKDIEHELGHMQEHNARLISIEDRPVETGDIATIDFEGFVDGKAFEGGKAEGHELEIGSNTFIPGFEDQVIGMNIDEEKEIKVKFPDEYFSKDLAGKEAMFKVKVHEIKKKELPELDDEFAKDVSEFDTLKELKADIKSKQEKQNEEKAKYETQDAVIKELCKDVKVDIPSGMIEMEIDNMIKDIEQRLSYQGLKLEQYLQMMGKTMEDIRKEYEPQAIEGIKSRLALEAVIKAEKIEATDKEIEEKIKEMAKNYGKENDKEFLNNENVKYTLGSVLNHVMLHQTVIGQELKTQLEIANEEPDTMIACVGGGSNFAGALYPFIKDKLDGNSDTKFIAVEPSACPTLTEGKYEYDFGDSNGFTPLLKMYTLGHDFVAPSVHAGGLRYHGMCPQISLLAHEGYINPVTAHQRDVFNAGIQFAKCEGIVPAPETTHAIKAGIDEAIKCRQTGEEKTIVINFSGHGMLDLKGYANYFSGEMPNSK